MNNTVQTKDLSTGSQPDFKLVARPKFRADIEGLRAIAILLVIAFHVEVPGFDGGYIGVDMFFAISGYLITWLLIYEVEKTGTVDLLRFYSRRARRLLPAIAVVLIVTTLIGALIYAPIEQSILAKTAFATATYHSNVYFAREAIDYLGAVAETNPLLHTWSLSVEEQFYFIWPLFVMLATGVFFKQKNPLRRCEVLKWMTVAIAISFTFSLYWTQVEQPAAFFLSPARAWEFGIGAVGVLVPLSKWKNMRTLLGWLGLAAILAATALFDEMTQFPGIAALLPTAGTVMILRAGTANSENWLVKILKWRGFQEIGRLSYSWYLWHWPVLVFAEVLWGDLPLLARVSLMVAALIFAEASYRWAENPIRHNNFLGRKPSRSIVMGVGITLFSVFLALSWGQMAAAWSQSPEQNRYAIARNDISALYTNNCHVDVLASEPRTAGCTFGDGDPIAKVILFGDSHAAQWYDALAKLATKKKWQLTPMTKSACPYVDVAFFRQELRREYVECSTWRQRVLTRIRKAKPDLVIVTSSSFSYPFSSDDWIKGTARTIDSLSKSSKNVIILRDNPNPGFDVPVCLARHEWRLFSTKQGGCEVSAAEDFDKQAYSSQRDVAERYQNVTVINMLPYICNGESCGPERGNEVVYSDSNHLTIGFTLTLTQVLSEKIDAAMHQDGATTS